MIYLAPVQGITDRIYRNLFPVYFKGVDMAIAPFISSSKKMKPENNLLREFYPDKNTGIPTIPQIMSSNRTTSPCLPMRYTTLDAAR
jgi:tRNA-dihydrouridine synthase B